MTDFSKQHSARRKINDNPVATWKPKKRICKGCKTKFQQSRANQIVCCYQCGIVYANWLSDKKKKEDQKSDRIRIRDEKIKLKTLSDWKGDLQKVINRIVRELDTGKKCLIRPDENVKSFDASHFYSIGSAEHLRFSLKNIYLLLSF